MAATDPPSSPPGVWSGPPEPGDPAPAFSLPDAGGKLVSLADFAGRSVIVFCYPAAGTPGCTTEACEFTAAAPELDTAGYTVIGISPDPPGKLAQFAADQHLADPAVRPGQGGADVLRCVRREEELRKDGAGGDPVHPSSSARMAASFRRCAT